MLESAGENSLLFTKVAHIYLISFNNFLKGLPLHAADLGGGGHIAICMP